MGNVGRARSPVNGRLTLLHKCPRTGSRYSAGMPTALDPHHLQLLQATADAAAAVPPAALTLARRRALAREANRWHLPPEGPLLLPRTDLSIPLPGRTLPARLYRPQPGAPASPAGDTLLVFLHGGGWVQGDLETHDNACAWLTQRLGCTLLSVEYRKSPEHRFPLPCDDAAEACAWAWTQAPAWGCRRIALAGDSAGAHLAAHAAHACAPQLPIAAMLLFYPVADHDFERTSYRTHTRGPALTAAAMHWYWEQFLGSTSPTDDPRAVLMRQRWQQPPPPTVLSLALHDPLYDEGRAYAELLRASGAQVTQLEAPELAHGFLRHCRVNAAAERHAGAAADALGALLAG